MSRSPDTTSRRARRGSFTARQRSWLRDAVLATAGAALVAIGLMPAAAQQRATRGRTQIAARSTSEVRDATAIVDSMRRAGELRLRTTREDFLVRGRTHERFDQYYRGVRVFGGDIVQQLNRGQIVTLYGNVYDDIDIDSSPEVDGTAARVAIETATGVEIGRQPELVVLPRDGGAYTLAWRVRAMTGNDIREYFVDADTGSVVFDYSDLKTQSAVGRGTGVLGDSKKISATSTGGQFTTTDRLRPPAINTYDMKSDLTRTTRYLNNLIQLEASDLATDSDNTWTDVAAVDAHVYSGWTYDYYFKRHLRRGLDNRDIPIVSLVHPVRRSDVFTQFTDFSEFYTNAFYAGDGVMVYGEGLPPNVTLGGQTWDYVAGALDIVAHELTHGVTDYSSSLIYMNESGALNEAFSDIMGTSVEFYFQPAGSGNLRADYLIGEDVVKPGGIRSMENPAAYGDPDHYSRRFTGPEDNGGVHINSGIANHAFYLAIEGGTNRTSGLSVQGVGGGNREQIERAFYRAFTQMLPANATFSVARSATIQAARDLFGANSNAERAITQAWTAVGVN
jgi:bacillolysin